MWCAQSLQASICAILDGAQYQPKVRWVLPHLPHLQRVRMGSRVHYTPTYITYRSLTIERSSGRKNCSSWYRLRISLSLPFKSPGRPSVCSLQTIAIMCIDISNSPALLLVKRTKDLLPRSCNRNNGFGGQPVGCRSLYCGCSGWARCTAVGAVLHTVFADTVVLSH